MLIFQGVAVPVDGTRNPIPIPTVWGDYGGEKNPW